MKKTESVSVRLNIESPEAANRMMWQRSSRREPFKYYIQYTHTRTQRSWCVCVCVCVCVVDVYFKASEADGKGTELNQFLGKL